MNLYRLLRASISDNDLTILQSSGEYQAVLVLLAIMVGFPVQAGIVFRALQTTELERWPEFVESLRPNPWNDPTAKEFDSGLLGRMTTDEAASWRRLCAALDGIRDRMELTSIRQFSRWTGLVGRFSFTTGRMLTGGP